MIANDFRFSVAAGAAPTNVAPSAFNPVPADGFIEVAAVTDPGIAGLTATPTLSVQLGGSVQATPLLTSNIGTPSSIGTGTPTTRYPDNLLLPRTAVRQGTNVQVLLGGGTGATATGFARMRFFTPAEAQAHPASV